jgi:hypothetical protein
MFRNNQVTIIGDLNFYLFFSAKLSAIPWFNSRVRHSMMKTARRAIDKKGKHHD